MWFNRMLVVCIETTLTMWKEDVEVTWNGMAATMEEELITSLQVTCHGALGRCDGWCVVHQYYTLSIE